jgi:carbon storage regulator CsrA
MSDKTRLVVSRRAGEAIVIGGNILIRVGATKRAVKLCIEAPREVAIVREELITGEPQPRRWGP